MWQDFQGEIDRGKKQQVRDYPNLDIEYQEKDKTLAGVSSDGSFVSAQDSYLNDINFNELFERKRAEIDEVVSKKIQKFQEDGDLDADDIEILKERLIQKETQKVAKHDIDPNLIAKRPDKARKEMRQILVKNAQNEATNLLSDYDLDEKGFELAAKFMRLLPYIKESTPNDGVIVMYINAKLAKKFGAVGARENNVLLQSINEVPVIIEELRRML